MITKADDALGKLHLRTLRRGPEDGLRPRSLSARIFHGISLTLASAAGLPCASRIHRSRQYLLMRSTLLGETLVHRAASVLWTSEVAVVSGTAAGSSRLVLQHSMPDSERVRNVASGNLVYMLQGTGIVTGIDLSGLIETSIFIASALGRDPYSHLGKVVRLVSAIEC